MKHAMRVSAELTFLVDMRGMFLVGPSQKDATGNGQSQVLS